MKANSDKLNACGDEQFCIWNAFVIYPSDNRRVIGCSLLLNKNKLKMILYYTTCIFPEELCHRTQNLRREKNLKLVNRVVFSELQVPGNGCV